MTDYLSDKLYPLETNKLSLVIKTLEKNLFKNFVENQSDINSQAVLGTFFFVNFDFKNGCKNEFEDNNEKSCSRFENRNLP